jgi:hypothetical protein
VAAATVVDFLTLRDHDHDVFPNFQELVALPMVKP